MFDAHQPIIARYAQGCPAGFLRMLQFVQLTIQQPLHTVPKAMSDVDRLGDASKYLWGYKANAFRHASANAIGIYNDAMELNGLADPERRETELLGYFAGLPGLGLAKAGFVLQLAFGLAGCIDTHNIARFGLDAGRSSLPSFLRADQFKGNPRSRARYVREYREACHGMGGASTLWDDWCTFVYNRYPITYGSAFNVSALHVSGLGLTGAKVENDLGAFS